jgi:hypothetical protein
VILNTLLHHTSTTNYHFSNDFAKKKAFPSPKGTDGVWRPHSPLLMGTEFPFFKSQIAESRGCSV